MNQEQLQYVQDRLQRGVSTEAVRDELAAAGYTTILVEDLLQAAASGTDLSPTTVGAGIPPAKFLKHCWSTLFRSIGFFILLAGLLTMLGIIWQYIPTLLADMQESPGTGTIEFILRSAVILGGFLTLVFFGAIVRFTSGATATFGKAWPKFGFDTLRFIVLFSFHWFVYSALGIILFYVTFFVSALPDILMLLVGGLVFTLIQSLLIYVWPLWSRESKGIMAIISQSISMSHKNFGYLFIRTFLALSSVALLIFLLEGIRLFTVGLFGLDASTEGAIWLGFIFTLFYTVLLSAMVIAVATVNYKHVDQSLFVSQSSPIGATIVAYGLLIGSMSILWLLDDFLRLVLLLS